MGKAESAGSPCERLPPLSPFVKVRVKLAPTPSESGGERGFHHPSLPDSSEVAGKTEDTRRISGLEKLEETTNENYKEKRKTETFKMKLVKCTRNLSYHSPTKNKKGGEFQTRLLPGGDRHTV